MKFPLKRWILKGFAIAVIAGIITVVFELIAAAIGVGSLLALGQAQNTPLSTLTCILWPILLILDFIVLGAVCEYINKISWFNKQ